MRYEIKDDKIKINNTYYTSKQLKGFSILFALFSVLLILLGSITLPLGIILIGLGLFFILTSIGYRTYYKALEKAKFESLIKSSHIEDSDNIAKPEESDLHKLINDKVTQEDEIRNTFDNIESEQKNTDLTIHGNNENIGHSYNEAKNVDKSNWKESLFFNKYLNKSIVSKMSKKFIAIDLETTGLSSFDNKIIEVGMVMFEDGIPTERYNQLINPGIKIPLHASEINGIYNETVKDMPMENKVCPKIIEFLGDAMDGDTILCAHNAEFDISFLHVLFNNNNPEGCHINYVDTLHYSRDMFNLTNYKLKTIASAFGIKNEGPHRAEFDAETCGKIMTEILTIKKMDISKKCDILDFTPRERDICRKIKTIIRTRCNNIDLLRFYKPNTKFIRVQCLFDVIKFNCLKDINYLLVPRLDAEKYNLEFNNNSRDSYDNVKIEFKSIEDLDKYGKYISDKYMKTEKHANDYIEASKIHREIAKEKMSKTINIVE